jgi:hypothetical protein
MPPDRPRRPADSGRDLIEDGVIKEVFDGDATAPANRDSH